MSTLQSIQENVINGNKTEVELPEYFQLTTHSKEKNPIDYICKRLKGDKILYLSDNTPCIDISCIPVEFFEQQPDVELLELNELNFKIKYKYVSELFFQFAYDC